MGTVAPDPGFEISLQRRRVAEANRFKRRQPKGLRDTGHHEQIASRKGVTEAEAVVV